MEVGVQDEGYFGFFLRLVFLLAFLLAALLQYNDPDPIRWVAIYIAAATLCKLQHFKQITPIFPVLLLIICLAWIGMLVPSLTQGVAWTDILDSLAMKTKAVEEAREIGGLVLVASWSAVIAINSVLSGRKPGAAAEPS